MTGKISRKGKNPGPVDSWLDSLGYYRKNVAYDETCLFRAVAEQLFLCQSFHERIRIECIDYGKNNYEEFKDIATSKVDWLDHLQKLSIHMTVCGQTEVHIISKLYRCNITIFDSCKHQLIELKKDEYENELMLCLMGEDHYDVVYKKEYIINSGFCQSIVYGILYESVFKIPDVNAIVQTMLYDKQQHLSLREDFFSQEDTHNTDLDKEKESVSLFRKPDTMSDYEYMLLTNLTPFPFKVAKALDPSIYRNIEYDTWTEVRKEMRLGNWYYGDNNLILGTRCLLHRNGETLQCYIQDIIKDTNQCVVYIINHAEKQVVNYSDLTPENDAKPWPIPYSSEKEKKNEKRRKEKKGCNRNSDKHSATDSSDNTYVFEGCPLQIKKKGDIFEDEKNNSIPELGENYDECQTNSEQWATQCDAVFPASVDLIWNQGQDVIKPVVPNCYEVPYPETCYYYDNNYRHQVWNNGNMEYIPMVNNEIPPSPSSLPMTPDAFNYVYYSDSTLGSTISSPKICNVPITASSPQVDMYSAPIFQPPTPIIYTPKMPDMVPITLFTPPPIEYIPTTPYCLIPSTPPNTQVLGYQYPPGVNSQGFIFPTPISNQNV